MTYNIETGILAFLIAFLLILMFHPFAKAAGLDAHTRDYRCAMYEVEHARLARGGKPKYSAEQISYYTQLYNQYCRK